MERGALEQEVVNPGELEQAEMERGDEACCRSYSVYDGDHEVRSACLRCLFQNLDIDCCFGFCICTSSFCLSNRQS